MYKIMLRYLILIVIVSACCYWAYENWDKIHSFIDIKPWYILIMVPLVVISLAIVGYINQVILLCLGLNLSVVQWMSLACASTLANYIFPMRAGMALRAAYLKKTHQLSLQKFAASMAFAYVLTFLVNASIGLISIVQIGVEINQEIMAIIAVFVLTIIGSISVLSLRFQSARLTKSKIFSKLTTIQDGWNILRQSQNLILVCSVLIVLNTLIFAFRIYVSVYAVSMGETVSYMACLFAGCLAALSLFVSITPASLGISELAIVLGLSVIGVPPEVGLLASVFDRVVSFIVVAFAGSVGMRSLLSDP